MREEKVTESQRTHVKKMMTYARKTSKWKGRPSAGFAFAGTSTSDWNTGGSSSSGSKKTRLHGTNAIPRFR